MQIGMTLINSIIKRKANKVIKILNFDNLRNNLNKIKNKKIKF